MWPPSTPARPRRRRPPRWGRSWWPRPAGAVSAGLEETAPPALSDARRQVVAQTAAYHRRNLPYMRYDAYLAQGWPSGTGVVEGACGHLVKDRMEQAGMRWTPAGA